MYLLRKNTHGLPVPAHREVDFTPERMVVPRLHDTVARFRAGTNFSLRCSTRGELAPVWVALAPLRMLFPVHNGLGWFDMRSQTTDFGIDDCSTRSSSTKLLLIPPFRINIRKFCHTVIVRYCSFYSNQVCLRARNPIIMPRPALISGFCSMKRLGVFLLPCGLPPALNSPVPIYTPRWREAPWE